MSEDQDCDRWQRRAELAEPVVTWARLLLEHIAEFGELEASLWGEAYDNLDKAISVYEQARGQEAG